MKEYTALHYVRDHMGVLHTPGEIFDAEYEDAAEDRLLRLNAVVVNGVTRDAQRAEDEEAAEAVEAEEAESDDSADVSDMIDVMEGISTTKTTRRRRK